VARKLLVLIAVLVPLTLAACGDDDEDTTAASSETTAAEETTAESGGGETVAISETDFALDPSDASTAAGLVTFDISNDGQTLHNLEIEGNGVEEELESDLAPGDSGELTLDLEAGTYEWYCPIDGHKDQGMEGELTVE